MLSVPSIMTEIQRLIITTYHYLWHFKMKYEFNISANQKFFCLPVSEHIAEILSRHDKSTINSCQSQY